MSTHEDDDGLVGADLFQEPEGFYPPEKQPTHTTYRMLDGTDLRIRLVGHNPLWGHHLWQGARRLAHHLDALPAAALPGTSVLELGAGAGLPSLVAARRGAAPVLVTDYPDPDLVDNLARNVAAFTHDHGGSGDGALRAAGFLWGADPAPLLAVSPGGEGFDYVLLADLLFNHSEHGALVATVGATLRRRREARALVFFSPYRPWLIEKDRAFFDVAREAGLAVAPIGEWVEERVMFEEDRGDELLRRTVFGFEMYWGDLQAS